MNPSSIHEEDPGLDGPDYVTLVIEWNDAGEITAVSAIEPDPGTSATLGRKIFTVLGALVALAFATWGLRRLRTVS
jgi:hypothetical protein